MNLPTQKRLYPKRLLGVLNSEDNRSGLLMINFPIRICKIRSCCFNQEGTIHIKLKTRKIKFGKQFHFYRAGKREG
ncbi:hypothetical protein EYC80_004031 [Monilinia laxa]|uniref:Uncharacterized protein n=1 Tax=Monilinia laxa TaxID=61186 RepID=A0A5N6KLI9_MONLA|nr:hypothetical protein EYC80_004031 [Monilinia laxa]